MEFRPILSFLKQQNSSLKSQSEQTDPFKQEFVIERIAYLMISAQIKISRCYRKWKVRQYKIAKIYALDVYFDENTSYLDQVSIFGDFTPYPWTDKIDMKYSFYNRAFKARVLMSEKAQFKFIVNGEYRCSNSYPKIENQYKNTNNILKLHRMSKQERYKRFISKSQVSHPLEPSMEENGKIGLD